MSEQPHHDQGLVDILEIYHARSVRDAVLRQLTRLRQDQSSPYHDALRHREVTSYYEAMLLHSAELLNALGDE